MKYIKYDLTGKIINGSCLSFDSYGCPIVSVKFDNCRSALKMVDDLKYFEKLDIRISNRKERRSLDANAYCFAMIDKLAKKLNLPKEEIYRNAIRKIGGVSDVVCIKNEAVETLCRNWEHNGLGWQTETFPSKIDGCTNVILYYGSSTYDTSQMSSLITNIVEDCKALGIDTKSPAELASLLDSWRGKQT